MRPDAELCDLVVVREEGFCDLTLALIELERRGSGVTFRAASRHAGTLVGVAVEVQPYAGGPREAEGLLLHQARVTLRSEGAPSDAFLALLAALYDVSAGGPRMVPLLDLAALSLTGDPARIAEQRTKLKLFHEPPHGPPSVDVTDSDADDVVHDGYFELYLNVDPKAGLVELREKDAEYRPSIIRALTAR